MRPLKAYFSEHALIRTRVGLEVFYLQSLSQAGIIRTFTDDEKAILAEITETLSPSSPESAIRIKQIESETHHDLQAKQRLTMGIYASSNTGRLFGFFHNNRPRSYH